MSTVTILPILRHLLQVLAGLLIAKGVLDNDAAAKAVDYSMEAAGGILSLISIVWMIKSKKKAEKDSASVTLPLFAAALLGVSLIGCSSVAPGNDPVVVNAERTTELALETFDVFVLWEYEHRATLAAVPEIRKIADKIRHDAPHWLASARVLTKAYKDNRSPENKVNLEAAIATLKAAIQEAQSYLSKG